MKSCEVTVKNPTGLHTRPGQRFVKQAQTYECDVLVKKDEKEANAKKSSKMLKLGISQNDVITIECNGQDEEIATQELVAFIAMLEE